MLAILAPGQGAQFPGCLAPWVSHAEIEKLLAEYSLASDLDLAYYGSGQATTKELQDTAVTQPILVATALLALKHLETEVDRKLTPTFALPDTEFEDNQDFQRLAKAATVIAGHSVGEITAGVLAGAFSSVTALSLARIRGLAMAKSCSETASGLLVCLGEITEDLLAKIAKLNLEVANYNGKNQIVVAGAKTKLQAFQENPPPGIKTLALTVAGAFHSSYMANAEKAWQLTLKDIAASTTAHAKDFPRTKILSNRNGKAVTRISEFYKNLGMQITAPVRWDLCQAQLRKLGVSGILELPPGRTLSNLAKRNIPEIEVFSLDNPDKLATAIEFIKRHGNFEK